MKKPSNPKLLALIRTQIGRLIRERDHLTKKIHWIDEELELLKRRERDLVWGG